MISRYSIYMLQTQWARCQDNRRKSLTLHTNNDKDVAPSDDLKV